MIDIYENKSIILNQKIPNRIISWTTILIILTLFILIFGNLYKFDKYLNYNAVIQNNNIILLIEKNKINNLKGQVMFNKKNYDFDIKEISEQDYYQDNKYYKQVILDMNLEDKYKIENNILNLYFKDKKTTLIKEIIDFIKKGLIT